MSGFESVVEKAAIEWLKELGWKYIHGSVLASDGQSPERASYASVILDSRFREALGRINGHLDEGVLNDVARKVLLGLDSPSLDENNNTFHQMVRNGVNVQVRGEGGTRGDLAWLFDFKDPDNNDWLVVNQLTVIEGTNNRRPDLVLYVNGLPLAVIELKNPEDEDATLESAWRQLQLYKSQIPVLFNTNEILVISDGVEARVGSLTAGFERFLPWRTVDGEELAPAEAPQLEVVLKGLFEKHRFLDYLYNFILCETGDRYIKKIAGYHQFHAANKAVKAALKASSAQGDKRIGVIWHTQGSGKSVSMCYFAGKIMLEPEMQNPTLVMITDRNDLDGQLFSQFSAAKDLIPNPKQAESREELRELLQVASGGVVFSTIQKFSQTNEERELGASFPVLSDRRNIVVIADEAHRTQYGFKSQLDRATGHITKGLAQNLREALPGASFMGFTGTPIEFADRSTPAVFGDYIDTYAIRQSVEDGATVPIHYEARLARINLPEEKKPEVDEDFAEVTEAEEESEREKLKANWAKLEALAGTKERLGLIANDLLDHWDRRLEIIEGKAMIVCMSRRVCVDLYSEIIERRPEWHSDEDGHGVIKVVMTGSASDPIEFHPHVRGKLRQKEVEKRFKDPDDPLKLVIVRDMWLTGFNVPCAHTLYVDKPMKGHGLLQAIARINRRFKDKPAGVVVDYIGFAQQLRSAVGRYGGGGGERPAVPVELALTTLQEKVEIVRSLFHPFDYLGYFGTDASEKLKALAGGANHICGRGVPPLSDEEEGRLSTIFKEWYHPEVGDDRDRAARLGDGSLEAAKRYIELMQAFLLEEVGSDNDKLYEGTLNALHRLLVEPSPGKVERDSATKELVLQVEPLAFKLLALILPAEWEKLSSKRKGLDTALQRLRKTGASPYGLKLSPEDFIGRVGGEEWTSLEHAVRDVIGLRLDSAHRAIGTEAHYWRSTLCVMLGLIAHNETHLSHLSGVPPAGPNRRKRFMEAMTLLNKVAGIALHLEGAREMRDEIGYFQAVQQNLRKYSTSRSSKTKDELNAAIKQIISGAVSAEGVVDIFGAEGLSKPDISILSDEFLESVPESPHPNLQLEVLKKLINDEVKTQARRNVVQARKFSEMLERTLLKYQNRSIEVAHVILELIELAKELRDAPKRGDDLGLSEDELAFYDALADHGDAREVMGDDVLARIAQDLVKTIRRSVTIDWTQKEAVRADMRRKVKKLLRKHGYPPDKREDAVFTVIEQAEQVCKDWSRAA